MATSGRAAVAGGEHPSRAATWAPALIALAAIIVAAGAELALGREPMCTCGNVKLWHGVVLSAENSQHLSDWYTPSHVIHGIGFYAILWAVARRVPLGWRFAVAVIAEAAWEVFENTPFVIDRYRAATISLDYYGDSVVNSMSDMVAMMAGFALAASARWWTSLTAVVAMEVIVALAIRDNLLLNILMLVHPVDAVRRWQAGG